MSLTKSDFLTFLDAPMHLWAKKHYKLEKTSPSAFDQHLMSEGQRVEKLANKYLQEVILKKYQGGELTLQQTFIDGQFEAIADGVIFDKQAQVFDIYEVKSSTNIKKENLYDATFQMLVSKANLHLRNVYLIHLNKDYIKRGELELDQLFVADDITSNCHLLENEILGKREQALQIANQETPNNINICYKPIECPCLSLCHPHLPLNSIYELSRLTQKKADELLELSVQTIKQIPDDFPLTNSQKIQTQAVKQNTTLIDQTAIENDLETLKYPLCFLDYETYNSAIPIYDGYHPQQQMVFQYSLHIIEANNQEIIHQEYLATKKGDPAKELVKSLRKHISDKGSVIVWNKTFEAGRNKEMAQMYPEYKDFLLSLNQRIYDLADIFKNNLYVDSKFKGSWSIKNVLPVLVPNLSYKGLTIGKGDQAMLAWWDMVNLTEEEEFKKLPIINALTKYCELDTMAMVEIWRKLNEILF